MRSRVEQKICAPLHGKSSVHDGRVFGDADGGEPVGSAAAGESRVV